jgi:hypothetical protein
MVISHTYIYIYIYEICSERIPSCLFYFVAVVVVVFFSSISINEFSILALLSVVLLSFFKLTAAKEKMH